MSASSEVGTEKETTETPEPLAIAVLLVLLVLLPALVAFVALPVLPAILAASLVLMPSSSAARSASTSDPLPIATLSYLAAALAFAAATSIAVVLACKA